jgi:hypothetical protein
LRLRRLLVESEVTVSCTSIHMFNYR